MKNSFEERLISLAGEVAFKTAKQLLKQKAISGAWRDSNERLCGCFQEPQGLVEVKVRTGEETTSDCSMHGENQCCCHTLALIMYAGRYKFYPEPEEEAPVYYGLRSQPLTELAKRGRLLPAAKLYINVINAQPHVPSKWEYMQLAVRMRTDEREYIGNQNNLRQLYFDKSLNITLKLDNFSLHEQQIIRFLAINGEAESSNIILNSELTSELFHSLVGFRRFFRDGRQLTIRPDHTEAVLLDHQGKLTPGILIGETILPLPGAKVITGKSGCWVGRDSEYFFVGANCETGFLRSFFRSSTQNRDSIGADFPLPIIKCSHIEPKIRQAAAIIDGFADNNGLTLSIDYLYRVNNRTMLFSPGTGTLAADGRTAWKRNRDFEHKFEHFLEFFGFELDESGVAKLDRPEAAWIFLDRAFPEYLRNNGNIAVSGQLTGMMRGSGGGLPELEIRCRYLSTTAEGWRLNYFLGSNQFSADWEIIQTACRERKEYLLIPNLGPVKIPSALRKFLCGATRFAKKHDYESQSFEVPFIHGSYYCRLAADVPGAMIPEIAAGPLSCRIELPPSFKFQGELRNYQQDGVAFMQYLTDRNFNVLLADEMGLGKTVQLLALLASRLERNGPPALLVCPASLVANWEREANRFVPELRVSAPLGNKRTEVIKAYDTYDLLILSYTAVRLSYDDLKSHRFSYLVLDEAQHIKNPGSGNAKICKGLKSTHRIVLTGTPLENSPEDLWSVMDFLHPGLLGTLPVFRREYGKIGENTELKEDLGNRVFPFIKRRTKREVAADLPSRSELTLFCEFPQTQRELYEQVLHEGQKELHSCGKDEKKFGAVLFTTLLRLRQVCCHPDLLGSVAVNGESAKFELFMELLHETLDSGHRVLIFSQFVSMLKIMVFALKKEGIEFEYLDGSTRDRQAHVDNFNQNPDIKIFLLSLKAGGVGLNLTSADTVIIYDPWWNPAAETQAADRTHRIGQTRPVTIIRLAVKNSVEEKIIALQGRKRELFEAVIEDPAAGGGMSLKELRKLLELDD